MLIHLIDMAGTDGRNPDDDFVKLNNELGKYSDSLKKKRQIIVANKMDMPEALVYLKRFKARCERGIKIYKISALTGNGLEDLLKAAAKELKRLPKTTEQVADV